MPGPRKNDERDRCVYCCETFPEQGESVEREEGFYHADCFEFLMEEERYKRQ